MHLHSFRIITATTEQMLLISENPGSLSQSLFHQKQSSNFIMLPSVNTLVCLETGKGPCDFIICSQREPEQTSWQGDYFGIWIPLSNYYAIPGGLIYCIPRYAGCSGKKIVGFHRRNKRAFLRRRKKGWEKNKIAGSYFDTREGRRQVVLMCRTLET